MYFKKEGMNSLAIVPCKKELMEGYQDHLFRYYEVPYFLNYEVRQINGSETVCYHLKYRTSMKAVMGHLPFTLDRLQNMVESIIGAIETAEDYLLDMDFILWKSENVFLEADTGKLQFCYYPVTDEQNGSLKELLMEIMQAVDKKQEEAMLFILQFYNLVTEENCTLELLRRFKNTWFGLKAEENFEEAGNFEEDDKQEKKDEGEHRKVRDKRNEKNKKGERNKKDERNKKNETVKENAGCQIVKILLIGTAVLDMLFILCLVFEILTYGFMKYLFIGLGVLIILTILYMQMSKEETADEIMQSFFDEQKKAAGLSENRKEVNHPPAALPQKTSGQWGETRLLSETDLKSEQIILEDKEKHFYFRAFEEGRYPDIYFEKTSIVIGCMPESCDYVLNIAGVSRMHAKLMPRADGLYLLDLNSTNGTYLNGEMMEGGKEYRLEEGDMVAFARCEFYVATEE